MIPVDGNTPLSPAMVNDEGHEPERLEDAKGLNITERQAVLDIRRRQQESYEKSGNTEAALDLMKRSIPIYESILRTLKKLSDKVAADAAAKAAAEAAKAAPPSPPAPPVEDTGPGKAFRKKKAVLVPAPDEALV